MPDPLKVLQDTIASGEASPHITVEDDPLSDKRRYVLIHGSTDLMAPWFDPDLVDVGTMRSHLITITGYARRKKTSLYGS